MVTTDANGRYTFSATAGQTYNLKKGTNQIFLFLILLPDGTTTSIKTTNAITKEATDTQGYNLDGQRVGKNYKGVMILNGKKVIRR